MISETEANVTLLMIFASHLIRLHSLLNELPNLIEGHVNAARPDPSLGGLARCLNELVVLLVEVYLQARGCRPCSAWQRKDRRRC